MATNKPNYKLMLALIEEVFATKNDPNQIQVTPSQMKKLAKIHPDTLSEIANENGPLIWILVIPTTIRVMHDFLQGKITEKGILDETPISEKYQAIYLCSATALPETRCKGNTKALCIKAISSMMQSHPIEHLFVWPFTSVGMQLAQCIANHTQLKLHTKNA